MIKRVIKQKTTHMRAGSSGRAAINALCLASRYWYKNQMGIALRDDIMIVNCARCRRIYAKLGGRIA